MVRTNELYSSEKKLFFFQEKREIRNNRFKIVKDPLHVTDQSYQK